MDQLEFMHAITLLIYFMQGVFNILIKLIFESKTYHQGQGALLHFRTPPIVIDDSS